MCRLQFYYKIWLRFATPCSVKRKYSARKRVTPPIRHVLELWKRSTNVCKIIVTFKSSDRWSGWSIHFVNRDDINVCSMGWHLMKWYLSERKNNLHHDLDTVSFLLKAKIWFFDEFFDFSHFFRTSNRFNWKKRIMRYVLQVSLKAIIVINWALVFL